MILVDWAIVKWATISSNNWNKCKRKSKISIQNHSRANSIALEFKITQEPLETQLYQLIACTNLKILITMKTYINNKIGLITTLNQATTSSNKMTNVLLSKKMTQSRSFQKLKKIKKSNARPSKSKRLKQKSSLKTQGKYFKMIN